MKHSNDFFIAQLGEELPDHQNLWRYSPKRWIKLEIHSEEDRQIQGAFHQRHNKKKQNRSGAEFPRREKNDTRKGNLNPRPPKDPLSLFGYLPYSVCEGRAFV